MPETYCALTKHNPVSDMHNLIQNIQSKEKKRWWGKRYCLQIIKPLMKSYALLNEKLF